MPSKIHTAQICTNGHIITDSIQVDPIANQKFCDTCGESLITNCLSCESPIKGREYIPLPYGGANIINLYSTKPFCYHCGKSYPWTENKLLAAKDLIKEIENLSDKDQEIISNSVDEIIKDSPRTEVEAMKFKRIISQVGQTTAKLIRDILIDIVSESAKKVIWPS